MNKTLLTSLSFLGAAIHEGQSLPGAHKGPSIIRNSGVFDTLKNIYHIHPITDYGDISI
jgi:arginase family enzyme